MNNVDFGAHLMSFTVSEIRCCLVGAPQILIWSFQCQRWTSSGCETFYVLFFLNTKFSCSMEISSTAARGRSRLS